MNDSTTSTSSFTEPQRRTLLEVARTSIACGVKRGEPLRIDVDAFEQALRVRRAVFVTLQIEGALRGCIGALDPIDTLIEDVARHAYAAAFEDPRFPPLSATELERLDVHLSVLSQPQPMTFADELDLLAQLRPGVDGLVLQEGGCRGTFLPAVWEKLPDPPRFLEQLKLKAGLPPGYWSKTIRVFRYVSEAI